MSTMLTIEPGLIEQLEVRVRDYHRGFIPTGEAKMYEQARVDLKESYIWGVDLPADDPDILAGNRMVGANRWPGFMPEMRPVLNAPRRCARVRRPHAACPGGGAGCP